MSISEKMKERRVQLNLKVKDVAYQIGVAESTYRDWENGRKIQGEPYQLIADALEMNILELMEIQTSSFRLLMQEVENLEKHIKNIRKIVM